VGKVDETLFVGFSNAVNSTPGVHASGALPVLVDFSALLAASRLPDYADSSEYILQDLGA
jgi:hypothetical protein